LILFICSLLGNYSFVFNELNGTERNIQYIELPFPPYLNHLNNLIHAVFVAWLERQEKKEKSNVSLQKYQKVHVHPRIHELAIFFCIQKRFYTSSPNKSKLFQRKIERTI